MGVDRCHPAVRDTRCLPAIPEDPKDHRGYGRDDAKDGEAECTCQRKESPDKQLWKKEGLEGHPAKPRPAHLPFPHLGETAPERLYVRTGSKPHSQPGARK